MENLAPGKQVTFMYQYCNDNHSFNANGTKVCLWVNMNDGVGNRFLAIDGLRAEGPEMYAHDIETFGDFGITEPIISCTTPTKMLGQKVRINSGSWSNLTGTKWNFTDYNASYEFRNVKFSNNPATWQTCSPTSHACPDPVWSSITQYVVNDAVYFNQHKWRARVTSTGKVPASNTYWQDLGSC
jgi:hypothetical protein